MQALHALTLHGDLFICQKYLSHLSHIYQMHSWSDLTCFCNSSCPAKELSHFTHRCQMFSWADLNLTCTCNLCSRSNDFSHFSHEYQMSSWLDDFIVQMALLYYSKHRQGLNTEQWDKILSNLNPYHFQFSKIEILFY